MPALTQKIKPINLYFPISRVDEDARIVEGYAFVNEVVPGEGGVRLKRSAMEEATANYIANGTCREIHQPSAAGRPLSVVWDETGALLRMHCVDDQAWEKVKTGVYKGFSVGVTPQVMRGKDVTVCEWWDTSLVDIGKDRDAKISCWRSKDIDPDAEVEVRIERGSFAEYLAQCAPSSLREMALDYLWNSLVDIQYSGIEDAAEKEEMVRTSCAEFTDFMVAAIATGILPQLPSDEERARAEAELIRSQELPTITRAVVETFLSGAQEVAIPVAEFERMRSDKETILTLTRERDGSNTELSRVQGLLTAAEGRVTELEQQPRRQPPVRNFQAMDRSFGSDAPVENADEIKKLKDEYAVLTRMKPTSDAHEGDMRVARISQLKRALLNFGQPV